MCKMVNQKVLIRDKYRRHKKVFVFLVIMILLVVTILVIFLMGYLSKDVTNQIVIENPLKGLVFANTNEAGQVDKQAVVEQAVLEFDADYINFILFALGIDNLHKSYVGYGNPVVELQVDNEIWSSEIDGGLLNTARVANAEKDLKITMSRLEAVEALLSSDINLFMKTSVTNGNTQIEMVANKVELGSKGYLAMYKTITGEEISAE